VGAGLEPANILHHILVAKQTYYAIVKVMDGSMRGRSVPGFVNSTLQTGHLRIFEFTVYLNYLNSNLQDI
jgi:hypothetical protein